MEEPGIVFLIGMFKEFDQVGVDIRLSGELEELLRRLNFAVLRCAKRGGGRWSPDGIVELAFALGRLASSSLERKLRRAILRASRSRQASISLRNSASTSVVPRFPLVPSANLSKAPLQTACLEKVPMISSQWLRYSSKL